MQRGGPMRGAPGSSSSSAASERGCCCRARTGSPAELCGLRPPEVGTHRDRRLRGGTGSRRGTGSSGEGGGTERRGLRRGDSGRPRTAASIAPSRELRGSGTSTSGGGPAGVPFPLTRARPRLRAPLRGCCARLCPIASIRRVANFKERGNCACSAPRVRLLLAVQPSNSLGNVQMDVYLPSVCCEHRAVLASDIICWGSVGRAGGRRGCRGLLCGRLWFVQVLGSSVCED